MPLPHFELSSSQYRLLAEAVLAPVPDPATSEAAQQECLARGLDPDDVRADVPELLLLGLVVRERHALSLTPLGTAAHYRKAHEEAERRLAAVAQLAEEAAHMSPRLARAVRRLAQGSLSLGEALAEVDGD
ncbi:hypothetical protein ACFS5L_09605 [Streptomyces phyllanthi]|uniref:Uncharacterized protein n=1 Tax=Streptomyces phyllanthi TaxID=1803180 RepID=A0A5N8W6Q7_9ACTN|nr:hypothetical protein [Streptomyces phyllanthi]MPY42004.1 hypothetical protein [Streptomyces phyllanthi]